MSKKYDAGRFCFPISKKVQRFVNMQVKTLGPKNSLRQINRITIDEIDVCPFAKKSCGCGFSGQIWVADEEKSNESSIVFAKNVGCVYHEGRQKNRLD